jgi:mannose PTS system EIID component
VTAVPAPRLGASFLRLFSVQGSWNYERLLGLGVGVAEEPLLRNLPGGVDGPAYRGAVARGAQFFNAHPYLCGLVVGASARAEHEGATPEQIRRLRAALAGPLGALGDRLVWAGLLPVLSALALVAIALGAGWYAVIGFLTVYNAAHVALRWWALHAGWTHGARVAAALHAPGLQRAAAWSGPVMAFVTGAALPIVAWQLTLPFEGWARSALLGAAAGGFALLQFRRLALSGLRLGLSLVAVALVAGWAWR